MAHIRVSVAQVVSRKQWTRRQWPINNGSQTCASLGNQWQILVRFCHRFCRQLRHPKKESFWPWTDAAAVTALKEVPAE